MNHGETAPGDQGGATEDEAHGVLTYFVGLALATLLTVVSFFITGSHLVWGPSIPVALAVLAIAQMGIHLVFFLHITTGKDSVNNVMALGFGVLIVLLLIAGSLWIMSHLNHDMMPAGDVMQMQR